MAYSSRILIFQPHLMLKSLLNQCSYEMSNFEHDYNFKANFIITLLINYMKLNT